jgi:hypothetical protein
MRRKRVTAAQYIALVFGLVGAVLQQSAATWHAFAQVSMASADAQIVADLQTVICHSGDATDATVPADDSRDPTGKAPKSDCLLCKGLADSCVAILADAHVAPLIYVASRQDCPALSDAVANTLLRAPRSRGPPELA